MEKIILEYYENNALPKKLLNIFKNSIINKKKKAKCIRNFKNVIFNM